MKKLFYVVLLLSFVLTCAVPVTGLMVHKLASTVFLLLCLGHTLACRKGMNGKRWALLGMIVVAFVSGVFAMIYDTVPMVTAVHKILSMGIIFFLAIHMFVYHRKVK